MKKSMILVAGGVAWSAYLLAQPAALAAGGDRPSTVESTTTAESTSTVESTTTVVATGDGTGTMNVTTEEHPDGKHVVVEFIDDKGNVLTSNRQVRVISSVAPGAEDRGWLGVALMPLATDGSPRIQVANVVSDSPAAEAGLEEGDVILAINGEDAGATVTDLAQQIGDIGPGGQVDIQVERDGRVITLSAVLAERKPTTFAWKSPFGDVDVHNRFQQHGKVLIPGPQGSLQMYDFGSDQDMPEAIRKLMNRLGTSTSVTVDDGVSTVEIAMDNDEGRLEVRREGDGPIVVRRKPVEANEFTETEYVTVDELEAADPEAFDLYNQSQSRLTLRAIPGNGDFDMDFGFGSGMSAEIRRQIEESLQNSGLPLSGNWTPGSATAHAFAFASPTKATRTFKVTADGQIEMTLRKGDSEVVSVYTDEADLQDRNPEAYDKYLDVMTAPLDE